MQRYKKSIPLLLILLVVAVITAMPTLRGQQHSSPPSREQRKIEFESQFPIADYSAPAPADPEQRAKREAKGKKYDKSPMTVTPSDTDGVTSSMEHWAEGLPAIPADQSNAIVIVEVTDAQAYLSGDKTGVYSEFTVRIDDVLKNNCPRQLTCSSLITVERPGGRVRFPSGHVGQYFTVGQGMPRSGRRYLLFLTCQNQDKDFQILTGYELRGGHIFLLDNPGKGHPISASHGKDEIPFLNEVRATIANSSQATPK
ncbi:MAG TPA: hypothetical protein VM911_01655 [Pyrinomonadaceae bacterium]|jgi:hypothetical protein|nr:hypothetical protein [Pyrinomonadaceae bacterium]